MGNRCPRRHRGGAAGIAATVTLMLRARKLRELTIDRHGPGRDYVSSASGLVRAGETIYVAADDERGLGVFPA